MANSVVRLSIDSHEFDANIKHAGEALNKFFDQAKKGDRTFEVLDDDVMEVVKTFGSMETKSKSARGQIAELTKGFTDFSMKYKQLTDAEKASPVGHEMVKQLDILKGRIADTKKNLAEIDQELSGSKFGQFGGIIDGIGHKMGVSANITELLTSKTALMTAGIGAAVAAIYKGTEAWTKYNAELSKQDQITQVTTGLKGEDADRMTDKMRALSDTYKVDFREAINAANTLMTQFGKTGDEATQLIKDGMQGMIQGDGGKLLNMIQQFAPAFRDAGISADKLVAIIHNSEGGLFSDQNMNAILMGIKNIRLMTKATSDSLAKLGIDGQEMSRKMSDGSLSVFEALKQVATKLKDCEAGSQEAGQVMQNVFGRQGAMQGMKLARAIAELNTNLEETKKQTGELGDAFAELQTANEKLNTAIRDCFEYDGWEQMATGIKAKLVTALADVLEKLADIKAQIQGVTPPSEENAEQARLKKRVDEVRNASKDEREDVIKKHRGFYLDMESYAWRKYNNAQANLKNGVGYYEDERGKTVSYVDEARKYRKGAETYRKYGEEFDKAVKNLAKDVLNPPKTPTGAVSGGAGGGGKTGGGGSATTVAKELSPLQQAQKEISALTEEALTADEERLEVIKKEIAALQEQINVYKAIQDYAQGKEPNWNIQVGDRKAFETEQRKRFDENTVTPSRLQVMEASVMKEIKVEDTKTDTETLHTLLKDALQNSIDTTSLDLTTIADQIGEGINVPDETWQAILDKYNELREQIGEEPITIDFNTGKIAEDGKKAGKTWKDAASAVQSVGSAFSQIEDPAAKAMGTVMQAIASIALGFAQAASAKDTTASGWAWLAWLAAGTAAMSTTIATIHSLTHFAEGGIVGGNDYTDNTPVMVSSGELILNRSQQGVLADALMSGNNQGGAVGGTPYVTGEKIVMGVNNWGRATGRGELVFSKS